MKKLYYWLYKHGDSVMHTPPDGRLIRCTEKQFIDLFEFKSAFEYGIKSFKGSVWEVEPEFKALSVESMYDPPDWIDDPTIRAIKFAYMKEEGVTHAKKI